MRERLRKSASRWGNSRDPVRTGAGAGGIGHGVYVTRNLLLAIKKCDIFRIELMDIWANQVG